MWDGAERVGRGGEHRREMGREGKRKWQREGGEGEPAGRERNKCAWHSGSAGREVKARVPTLMCGQYSSAVQNDQGQWPPTAPPIAHMARVRRPSGQPRLASTDTVCGQDAASCVHPRTARGRSGMQAHTMMHAADSLALGEKNKKRAGIHVDPPPRRSFPKTFSSSPCIGADAAGMGPPRSRPVRQVRPRCRRSTDSIHRQQTLEAQGASGSLVALAFRAARVYCAPSVLLIPGRGEAAKRTVVPPVGPVPQPP